MEPIIIDRPTLLGYSGGMALYIGNWIDLQTLYPTIIWWDRDALCLNFSNN